MMKPNTWLSVSLSVAAILAQAGCSETATAGKIPGIQSEGSTNLVTLPAGTAIAVRTTSVLSTNTQEAGETFTTNLDQPLLLDGREIASRGEQAEGTIVDADKGGRVKGVASLTVRLTGLHVGVRLVDISTNTVTRNARATKRKDATEIAIGSGIGAAIGAIAGGGKGAGIGAAAGGGAGTGVVLATRGEPAVISSETLLTFELRAPVTVRITQ